jgi:MoaA/NifB/PqqE/SkfB family radical SAM enzyme
MIFHITALTRLIRARFSSPTPLVLCHRINYECNLHCVFCPFWREKPRGAVLGKGEVFELIDNAADLGAIMYNVWGTEPLLRADLEECLAHAKCADMRVSLITNGTLLGERFSRLSEYVDYLVVSLDGVGRTYEKIRGVDAYDRVVKGLKTVSESGVKASVNCVVCAYNLRELPLVVQLANDLGMYATFEPVHYFDGLPDWEEIRIKDMEEYRRAVDKLLEMKRAGYKIGNSIPYLKLMRDYSNGENNYTCHVGSFLLQVAPDGRVKIPCTRYGCVGSVRNEELSRLWSSPIAQMNRELSAGCSSCLFSGFVEASLLYDLNPGAIANFTRIM